MEMTKTKIVATKAMKETTIIHTGESCQDACIPQERTATRTRQFQIPEHKEGEFT